MKDYRLSGGNIGQFITELTKLVLSSKKAYRVNVVEWREKRSLSQNAFQHVIYQNVSKYLISKGRTDWNEAKVKRELKNKFLGWELVEFTDVVTGEITTHEQLKETSKLDVGESCHYTTQILDWAESIGCSVNIPENSEYAKLMRSQND